MPQPSVGRIVHYVSYGTPGGEYNRECRAAVITEVSSRDRNDAPVGLCVLNPTGQFFSQHVHLDEGKFDGAGGTNLCGGLDCAGGTWHWPARVPDERHLGVPDKPYLGPRMPSY